MPLSFSTANQNSVSVIILAANSSEFLLAAIESVLSQTEPAIEIVVVEDGEIEDTNLIVRNRYPELTYIHHPNHGAGAKNAGIGASRGEYVVFLDRYDCLVPDAIEIGVGCLQADPKLGFAFGRCSLGSIDPDDPSPTQQCTQQPPVASYATILAARHRIYGATTIFRRGAIEAVGGFDPSLGQMADLHLYLRIAQTAPIEFHDRVVAEFRDPNVDSPSDSAKMLASTLAVHNLEWNYVVQSGNPENLVAYELGRTAWMRFFESSGASAPCLHHLFEQQVAKYPDRIAVGCEDQKLTYLELNHRANQLAHYLQSLGVAPNVLVGLCIERSLYAIVGILGILKAGGAYLPIDPSNPPERSAYILQDAQAKILVTTSNLVATLASCDRVVCLDTDLPTISQYPIDNSIECGQSDNLAYIIYTSGSTGQPKGVVVNHGNVTRLFTATDDWYHFNERDVWTLFHSIAFDVSVCEIWGALLYGGKLIVVPYFVSRDPTAFYQLLASERVTVLSQTPSAFYQLNTVDEKLHSSENLSLRLIIFAGEALNIPSLAPWFDRHGDTMPLLVNMYGTTETTVHAMYRPITRADLQSTGSLIGCAIPDLEIYLLDEQLQPVPIGTSGEIYIGGAGVTQGYWQRPELTQSRFIAHPFSQDPNSKLYKTGDLGRYFLDGNMEYIGRIDNQVKIRGFRIELGEIEAALSQHLDIEASVVIVREDEPSDKRLVAYIATKNSQISANELRELLARTLPAYMIPSSFEIVAAFPLTVNGKVDRRALSANKVESQVVKNISVTRPVEADLATSSVPKTSTEHILIAIWSEVLGEQQIGIYDNFFDLGGTSVLILKVGARIQAELDIQTLPVVKLFQYSTIAKLAQYLDNASNPPSADDKFTSRAQRQQAAQGKLPSVNDGIAIVGMAGRFPGARNVDQLWQNLCAGIESTTLFADAELDPSIDPQLRQDSSYVKAKGTIEGGETFDAAFFGISPREAEVMDPQARVFLELVVEALENAAYTPDKFDGLIGLYAGCGQNTYFEKHICGRPEIIDRVGEFLTMLANEKDYLTTRAAYKLNLTGPTVSVNTACSTSLVAVSHAFQSLMSHQCDLALAGGISLTTPQNSGYLSQAGGMLSPDGHCRPFDVNGQGTMFNNGAGLVVLKRLEAAIEDGDRIYAVIRGVGINNDGADKVSFTAPSVDGQAQAIAMAQAYAGFPVESISYIETHGTATPLGDPIEIAALTQVFRTQTAATQFCAVGSIKSNIGHVVAAAGVAGLIKTALALYHKQIPASLNFESPNPKLDLENSPFYVNTQLCPWAEGNTPRRAGVSSFGVGGTNAHVVLEEAPPGQLATASRPRQLLLLSAKTEPALAAVAANLAQHLAENSDINLADVAYTLNRGRKDFNYRRCIVAADVTEAIAQLRLDPPRDMTRQTTTGERPIVFMFPGQGSQYVGMGQNLYEAEPLYRELVDRCAEILQPLLNRDLRELMYPAADIATAEIALKQTLYTQPALFVTEYALAKLWQSWGVQPTATIGHSIGEFVSACLAGVFSLEDALMLVAARGKLMWDLPGGSMLSVRLPAAEVEQQLTGTIAIAAVNSPTLCVVAGETAQIELFRSQLEAAQIACRELYTSHAFHSPMMDEIIAPFAEVVRRVKLSPPQIPFVSTVTGDWITHSQATDPLYWATHLRQTVRFADGIHTLWQQPNRILLEVGPRTTATTLARQQATDIQQQIAISSLTDRSDNSAELTALFQALGQLWLAGGSIDWHQFYQQELRSRIPLPTYPFERQRYWIEPTKQEQKVTIDRSKKPDIADWFYVPTWKTSIVAQAPRSLANPILVFVDRSGFGAKLVTEITRQAGIVITVEIGKKFQQLGRNRYQIDPAKRSDYEQLISTLVAESLTPQTILHLWNVTAKSNLQLSIETIDLTQTLSFYSLLYLAQALGQENISTPTKLLVVSNQLHQVTGEEILSPSKATLLGPVRVIAQEYPHIDCRSVDIVWSNTRSKADRRLVTQLLSELQRESLAKILAYRGERRWVQDFEALPLLQPATPVPALKTAGVYLVTGGLGGIGLEIAAHLAKTVQAKLILIGRSTLPDRSLWPTWLAEHDDQDETSTKIHKVQKLESWGAKVLVVSADVANLKQMTAAMATARQRFGDIDGVIHTAGLPGGGMIQLKTPEAAARILAAKVQGTVVLDRILKKAELDFFVLCSSVESILGQFGQVDYGAANAFLDAYAQSQPASRRAISINWDSWQQVGMAVSTVNSSNNRAGIINLDTAILPQEGIAVFDRLLGSGLSQVVVSTTDLPARMEQVHRSSVTELAGSLDDEQSLQFSHHPEITPLEKTLAQVWRRVLGMPDIGLDDDFFDLGGDSLLAVQLFNLINKTLGKQLPLATIVQHRTIRELAQLIGGEEAQGAKTWSSLVPIQSGKSGKLPLFFIHPVGGNILEYYPLAKYMGQEYPMYGLQSQGLDGKQPFLSRIEDMASHYIQEIRMIQPDGPYLLIGYSMGATIAYEIAVQLSAQGQKIALLGLLDQLAPNTPKIRPSLLTTISIHWRNLAQLPSNRRLNYFKRRTIDRFRGFEERDYILDGVNIDNLNPELLNMLDANIGSSENYIPGNYPGDITLFRCNIQPICDAIQPQLGWERIVTGNIKIYPMEGDHFTLLREPFTKVIADKLMAAIESAHSQTADKLRIDRSC